MMTKSLGLLLISASLLAFPAVSFAEPKMEPEDLTAAASPQIETPATDVAARPAGIPVKRVSDAAADADDPVAEAIAAPVPSVPLVQHWPLPDAKALLAAIEGIGKEGLIPADYNPAELGRLIAAGESAQLDLVASTSFRWLVEDMRDGRTPMDDRVQWFVVDPDPDLHPSDDVLIKALASHDIKGSIAALAPTVPDYARLKEELAATPKTDKARRALIQANLDRWRWLPRELGKQYLLTNVPEYQLRLTVNNKIIRSYKTIVGKPGRTATPQLAEEVEGVIFNPTWTVPQSIVKGEGLGARLLANPRGREASTYNVTRGANGYVSVVQKPGPWNALGLMKLDMPNEHAIFLHDTPNRDLFNQDARALSHGCIRTERASELAITLAILRAGMTPEEGVALTKSGEYTKVAFTEPMPVYITYFTMAQDIAGTLSTFNDLYGRDQPVLASFKQHRQEVRQRVTDEAVVPLEDPGV